MTVTKALCGQSAPFVKLLEHQFELGRAPFEDACTRVAQLYLQPCVDAPPARPAGPTIVLTVNGQTFGTEFNPSNAAIQDPDLRLYGRDLVRALAKTIEDEFVNADVPREVASLQAEVIASQLGRDPFLKADSALGEARSNQCLFQQAIDVRIDGTKVRFYKTTTYVADEVKNDANPAVVRVVDVAVTFGARQGKLNESSTGVRRFGERWILEAQDPYAAVRERNEPGARGAIESAYGVPATPNWFGRLIQWFKLTLGAQGIVIDERNPGTGAGGQVPARPELVGLAVFEADAVFVSAQQSRKRWCNGMAEYRLHQAMVSHNNEQIHGSQRLDPWDSEAENALKEFRTRGKELCKRYYRRFVDDREVKWGRPIPTEGLRYGEIFIRGTQPTPDATALCAQAKLDLYRELLSEPYHVTIDMPNRSADPHVGDAYMQIDTAYKALHEWRSANRAELGKVRIPSEICRLLQEVDLEGPGITGEDFATRVFTAQDFTIIAEALAMRMADAVIAWINVTFTDDVMRRRMLEALTQSGLGATREVIKGYGAIDVESIGGRKVCIKCDPPESGEGPPGVMLEHHWNREFDPDNGYAIIWEEGSTVSEADEIASANLTVSSAWRLTPAGMELREAEFKAHVVFAWPEDEAAKAFMLDLQLDKAVNVYLEVAKAFQRDRKHRLAATAYMKAAGIYTGENLHTKAAEMYEEAAQVYLKAPLSVQAAGAFVEAAEAYLRDNEYWKAINAYKTAAALYERAGQTDAAANTTWKLAAVYTQAGRPDKAAEIYMKLGEEYVRAGQYEQSVKAYRSAGLTDQRAYEMIATVCTWDGQYEEATRFYMLAGLTREAERAYRRLADDLVAAGRYAEAVTPYMLAGMREHAEEVNELANVNRGFFSR
ncbi:soluble NSF attachment family protein [Pandoraea sputorum]|nr:hypothetical protein [Pandoraea sputorum]